MGRVILIFFSLLGMVNGLVWAALFWIWPRRKKAAADRIMGLLLLALALRVAKSTAMIWTALPFWIIHLGLACFMATGPLLFLHFQSLLNQKIFRVSAVYLHLLPVLLQFTVSIFLDFPRGHRIWEFRYGFILFWVFGYLLFSALRFRKSLFSPHFFRNKEQASLWLMVSLFWLFYLLHWQLRLLPYGISAVIFAVYTYLIMIMAVKKRWHRSPADPDKTAMLRREFISRCLMDYLQKDEVYSNSLLTLPKVAHALSIPPHELTAVLRLHFEKGFPEMINTIRLNEIARRLKNKKHRNRTISAIAFACGFNSLSSFNSAFRKHFRQTPSAFRKKHCL